MIIRNNQTLEALKRLGIVIIVLFSIQALSFKTKNNADKEFIEIYQYGKASYYAGQFIGRKTANGEIFTSNEYTCAHKTLPFGTKLKVTNLETNESIIVRVNDRGPYVKNRIVDLSLRGAHELGLMKSGVANVSIEIVNKQFSSLGNTKNMDRVFVDHQFAYVKSNDDDTYDKLYTYLSESQQLAKYAKAETVKEEKIENIEELKSIDFSQPIITDSTGTSSDKQAFVIEE
jgi:rare lipoprotein A